MVRREKTGVRSAAWTAVAAGLLAAWWVGCSRDESKVAVGNPFNRPMTFAVAPVLNFSGQFDLDPIRAADLLASELSFVEGVSVLPVNRVIAYLAVEGKTQIESPAHALAVAEAIGADAILVAGITEYDPYTPVVGLALQMYSVPAATKAGFDAVQASRLAQPVTIVEMADTLAPTGQVQVVYNATHEHVVEAVRHYAKVRSEGESPLGWQQYLKVQTMFLRFCWHDAVERLLRQQGQRGPVLAGGEAVEVPA